MVLGLVMATSTARVESARAFFVFGDSLVDNGNNNFLATTARADSPPYGIDTPNRRPTELRGDRLLVGANFASAGIGILNDTGIQFINIIRMYKQLKYFEQYQARLTDLVGYDEVRRIVNDALILITVGGNDFVNNYYLIPFSPRSRQFSLPDYVRYLISEYKKLLMRLYDLGARKVLVTGTGPMGCVPAELAMRSPTASGSNIFIAANTQQQTTDFINDPAAYGKQMVN
ncbi:GDSL esterase/lipase [Hibiscus syriacus]|uniref:GDSL esterase/lipase n=1 Tax=Hibiscus syriacus TaxID=106335 RepID=A0A6A2YZ98_HIBSY|nr:GDSL esterase/lipase [Hibiscus syriacus]